jgi:hypothetical protein
MATVFSKGCSFSESASASNIGLTHSQMFLTSFYLYLTLLVAHDVGSSSPVVDEHVSAIQDGGLIARPPQCRSIGFRKKLNTITVKQRSNSFEHIRMVDCGS